MRMALPEYRSSFFVDGYTYKLSVRFPGEETLPAGEQPHSHARYELHACAGGRVTLGFEEGQPMTLESGECCVIPPMVYHTRKVTRDAGRCYVMLLSCPRGAPLRRGGESCIRLQAAEQVVRCLQELEQEMLRRRLGCENAAQSLCTLLLLAVLRELTALPQDRQLPMASAANQREDLIDNYFALHYWYDISAGDLADRIGVTTRQLARIMQQRYGCTFRQRLLEIRLYHARRYLTTTRDPVWQIATACGFSNQGAFSTAFRKQAGCSPSEYRRTNGNVP